MQAAPRPALRLPVRRAARRRAAQGRRAARARREGQAHPRAARRRLAGVLRRRGVARHDAACGGQVQGGGVARVPEASRHEDRAQGQRPQGRRRRRWRRRGDEYQRRRRWRRHRVRGGARGAREGARGGQGADRAARGQRGRLVHAPRRRLRPRAGRQDADRPLRQRDGPVQDRAPRPQPA